MRLNGSTKRSFACAASALLAFYFYTTSVSALSIDVIVHNVLCSFFNTFYYIAGAIASLIIVIGGVKWTASENDPGARKAAKDAIIHAIVGLIIVIVATAIVSQIPGMTSC
jgi:hypothetical protein